MNNAIYGGSSTGSWTTPVVRVILGINGVVFLLSFLTGRWISWRYALLSPEMLLHQGCVWQLFTYMYVHFDLMHTVANMLGLWIFGPDVERIFGGRRFFIYYTFCGVGAALTACAFYPHGSIIGASGAIYGVLLAFAVLFPHRPLYLFGVAPIEARWLAVMYGVIDLVGGIQGIDNTAHFAHLGGLAAGILVFAMAGKISLPFIGRRNPSQPSIVSRWIKSRLQKREVRRKEQVRLSEAELDAILDKIAKSGMNSLTHQERERLKNASAYMRRTPD